MSGQINTYTGRPFWPLEPHRSEIVIEDIAHALSLTCRFRGHCSVFYSVAQHSILVSSECPDKYALVGLLHDAPEAYLADLPDPIKRLMPDFNAAEKRIWAEINIHFKLGYNTIPQDVQEADKQAFKLEFRTLMAGDPPKGLHLVKDPNESTLIPLGPEAAELAFLNRFQQVLS